MRALPNTILVVDDDRDARETLCELLEDHGYDAACAGHGDEALAFMRDRGRPAVLILDLMMPVMNGWELLSRLRHDPELEDLPVILATAAGAHWGHPLPAEQVVQKPFDMTALVELVRRLIARGRGGDPGPSSI